MEWITFLLNNKVLARISFEGVYVDELVPTKELLAYENNVPTSSIRMVLEEN